MWENRTHQTRFPCVQTKVKAREEEWKQQTQEEKEGIHCLGG